MSIATQETLFWDELTVIEKEALLLELMGYQQRDWSTKGILQADKGHTYYWSLHSWCINTPEQQETYEDFSPLRRLDDLWRVLVRLAELKQREHPFDAAYSLQQLLTLACQEVFTSWPRRKEQSVSTIPLNEQLCDVLAYLILTRNSYPIEWSEEEKRLW